MTKTSRTGIENTTNNISSGIIHNETQSHVLTFNGEGINISFFGCKKAERGLFGSLGHHGFYSLAEVC